MMRASNWSRQNLAALALLAVAGVLVLATGRGSWTRPLLPAEPSWSVPDRSSHTPAPVERSGPVALELDRIVLHAVARDPFHPRRTRPVGRYRLPGTPSLDGRSSQSPPVESATPNHTPVPAPAPLPRLRVVGLVASGGGQGSAAIEIQGQAPRLVSAGDTVAGFRLLSVSPTEARLIGRDTTLVLRP